MSFKKNFLLLLYLVIWINTLLPSIITNTLIRTPEGYVASENIAVSNTLIASQHQSLSTAVVTHITKKATNTIVAITTKKGCFYASPDQLFYDPITAEWIAAKSITTNTIFLDANLDHCACLNVTTIAVPPTDVYHISTTSPHTFFVTEQELLTHNAFPIIVISIGWLFGEGLKFAGLNLGAAALGSYVGINLYNKNKHAKAEFDISLQVDTFGGYSPNPNDDDKNLFESLKSNSDKKMRHKRFGNFYRDPNTKLWWSKDNANHGGSIFKVFKETAKGLEWTFDADGIGHQIIAKHKAQLAYLSHTRNS